MLQLNIRSYPIRLAYDIQNAQLNLRTTPSKVEMETIPPRLEIRQPRGELDIDWSEYYYSLGIKNIADFARDYAERGRQAVLEAIAETVAEGDRLAQITNPNNAFAELAAQSQTEPKGELSWTPIKAPSIHYQASPAEIELIRGTVNYEPHTGVIDGDYHPSKVDVRVTQYPKLDISVVDVKV